MRTIVDGWLRVLAMLASAWAVSCLGAGDLEARLEKVADVDGAVIIKLLAEPDMRETLEVYAAGEDAAQLQAAEAAHLQAAEALLYMLGEDRYEEAMRARLSAGPETQRLLVALALRERGHDDGVPLALRIFGETLDAYWKRGETEPTPAFDAARTRMRRCVWVLSRLSREVYQEVGLAYMGHEDPAVRKGALAVLQTLRGPQFNGSLEPDAPTSQGYDYHADAEANAESIAQWKATLGYVYEGLKQDVDAERRHLLGIKTPKEQAAAERREKEKEQRRMFEHYRAAETDEERTARGKALETYRREVLGWSEYRAWVDYPGNEPQPSEPLAERRDSVGVTAYLAKWMWRKKHGPKEDRRAANSRFYAIHHEPGRLNEFIEEGLAYLASCRQILETGSEELSEEKLDYMASLVIECEGRLKAQTNLEERTYRTLALIGTWTKYEHGAYKPEKQERMRRIKQELDALKAQYRQARAAQEEQAP